MDIRHFESSMHEACYKWLLYPQLIPEYAGRSSIRSCMYSIQYSVVLTSLGQHVLLVYCIINIST